MDDRSPLDAADQAEFSLLWLDHAHAHEDCVEKGRALLSIAQCMAEMGDPQTAAELRTLAARHCGHAPGARGGLHVPRQTRGPHPC
ncbi:hypothetical protein [Streptomyces sp. NPDC089919]|uniref:hypothetical protein n=1 Tax=Streptomyces sp. NPDC089919 TaxID=3155188 RepID=UPI0034213D2B